MAPNQQAGTTRQFITELILRSKGNQKPSLATFHTNSEEDSKVLVERVLQGDVQYNKVDPKTTFIFHNSYMDGREPIGSWHEMSVPSDNSLIHLLGKAA